MASTALILSRNPMPKGDPMPHPSVLFALLLALLPLQARACTLPPAAESMVSATLAAINAERDRRGMAPLATDPRLTSAAQAHACDSATRGRMGHEGSDGSTLADRVQREGYRYRSIAENVALGYPDPTAVVQGWMGSSGHRRNLLMRNARDAGIGLALGRDGALHWVLNLGTAH